MEAKDLDPKDYKYFVEKPNATFSPERNKAIIQETITSTEKYFRGIGKVIDENLGNRIDILASYGTYRFNRGTKSFGEYVGKRMVSQLIGEKILEKIRVAESVNKLNGNDKYKGHILL